jgi:molybdenum cofactor cytidylyltransferase
MTGLVDALGLDAPPGLVSIVGGGGKSSLMFALGSLLPGRVVMTTTTRIFAAQTTLAPSSCSLGDPGWRDRIAASAEPILLIGYVEGDRAVGVPPELPGELIASREVDWVIVEADGSRMRPVKAPAEHEPVIPAMTTLLVVVAGIDALAGPIEDVAHRPERVARIIGRRPDERLTPESLATLLVSEDGGLKSAPASARRIVLLNKIESAMDSALADEVATAVLARKRVERVVAGALQRVPAAGFQIWPPSSLRERQQ